MICLKTDHVILSCLFHQVTEYCKILRLELISFDSRDTHLWHISETVEQLLRLFQQMTELVDDLALFALQVEYNIVVHADVAHDGQCDYL